MNVKKTNLDGVIVIKNKVFQDTRGSFKETFNSKEFKEAGISSSFYQDNESISKKCIERSSLSETCASGKACKVR